MIDVVNLDEKIRETDGRAWFPVEIARVNDQVVVGQAASAQHDLCF